MPTTPGVITDVSNELWPKNLDSPGLVPAFPFKRAHGFKMGEGGWEFVAGVYRPRTPDPALTDLDVIVNPGFYPGDTYYPVAAPPDPGKLFIPADFDTTVPGRLGLRCRLEAVEAVGLEFWELGVFDEDSNMIAYFTFGKQVKGAFVLENYVNITFGS